MVDREALAQWWGSLNDSTLAGLIERAVANNLDLRAAEARVRESRARRGLAAADRFPTVTVGGSATASESGGGSPTGGAVVDSSTTLYSAGFDASWEADLFGAKRSSLEAATATLDASVEELRDVLVTLTSEVAINYVEVRLTQARLATANAVLQTQQDSLEIAQFRLQAGLTNQLDVDQAQSSLEQTRASIPALQATVVQAMNRVDVLLGQFPGTVATELDVPRAIPDPPITLAIGLPAEVLSRRPDVRRAERQLAAQTARVAVATAARYPRLTLIGSIGLEALAFSNLLSTAARALTGSLGVSQNVFDAGRIRQNIAIQAAIQDQAAVAYDVAVLGALEDVENALVAYAEEQARLRALVDATEAARRAAALADQRYRAGLTDFLVVLIAQRSLLTLEDQLAISRGTVASNVIRLYKAAGGGWSANAASRTP